MRQRIQKTLYKTGDAGDTLWTADAVDTLLDRRCRRHSMRQRMQETLFGTADAGDTLSDRRCRIHSMGQLWHQFLYGTADAEDTIWDN